MVAGAAHIYRAKDLRLGFEWTVRVCQDGRFLGDIDPRAEILRATGIRLQRYSRVVSFADGIAAAGIPVFIHSPIPGGGYIPVHYHRLYGKRIVLMYFFFGLAWARGEWKHLVWYLCSHVDQKDRMRVLERTADYYFHNPPRFYDKLRLVI